MVKATQIICIFAIIFDLIVFITQGDIRYLLMAGIMFMCFDCWMKRE